MVLLRFLGVAGLIAGLGSVSLGAKDKIVAKFGPYTKALTITVDGTPPLSVNKVSSTNTSLGISTIELTTKAKTFLIQIPNSPISKVSSAVWFGYFLDKMRVHTSVDLHFSNPITSIDGFVVATDPSTVKLTAPAPFNQESRTVSQIATNMNLLLITTHAGPAHEAGSFALDTLAEMNESRRDRTPFALYRTDDPRPSDVYERPLFLMLKGTIQTIPIKPVSINENQITFSGPGRFHMVLDLSNMPHPPLFNSSWMLWIFLNELRHHSTITLALNSDKYDLITAKDMTLNTNGTFSNSTAIEEIFRHMQSYPEYLMMAGSDAPTIEAIKRSVLGFLKNSRINCEAGVASLNESNTFVQPEYRN